jgi:hypothetical protein
MTTSFDGAGAFFLRSPAGCEELPALLAARLSLVERLGGGGSGAAGVLGVCCSDGVGATPAQALSG